MQVQFLFRCRRLRYFLLTSPILLFLAGPISVFSQTTSPPVAAGQKCKASPKVGDPVQEGTPNNEYRLVCGMAKAKDANCGGECEFKYRCKIQFFDGNNWVNTDTTKGQVHKDVYNAWHKDTGEFASNNISWEFKTRDTTIADSNNTSEFGPGIDIKVACNKSKAVKATVSSNTPINPNPASDPNGTPTDVSMSVSFTLKCSKCKIDTIIFDSIRYELPVTPRTEAHPSASDEITYKVFNGAEGHPVLWVQGNAETDRVQVRMFDLQGRQIMLLSNKVLTPGGNMIALPAQNLSAGIYVLQLEFDSGYQSASRIVIAR